MEQLGWFLFGYTSAAMMAFAYIWWMKRQGWSLFRVLRWTNDPEAEALLKERGYKVMCVHLPKIKIPITCLTCGRAWERGVAGMSSCPLCRPEDHAC